MIITTLCLILISCICFSRTAPIASKNSTSNPRVLLISYDGFSANYLKSHSLPNFQNFINEGVFAKTVSIFTTLTFPNHYSMVTGLNADKHGIVGNNMYDKFMNQSFNMACCNEDNLWWQQNPNVLPIWQANQKFSSERKSGAVGFVGSLTKVCGMGVYKVLPYTDDRTFKEIVDTMIDWFTDKEDPLNFISIYFNEPDKSGHNFGPLTDNICEALRNCDNLLGYIREQMNIKGIWDSTNVIITTDHGMTTVNPLKSIVLEDLIDLSKCSIRNSLSIANIYVNDINYVTLIHHNLSNIPNFNVYYRETVPSQYRYNNNIRIGDVVLVPDEGYLIYMTNEDRNRSTIAGTHGYNNTLPDMLGIFTARGPDIAALSVNTSKIINITDVYPLMEELLNLSRSNVDGSYENIKDFLKVARN